MVELSGCLLFQEGVIIRPHLLGFGLDHYSHHASPHRLLSQQKGAGDQDPDLDHVRNEDSILNLLTAALSLTEPAHLTEDDERLSLGPLPLRLFDAGREVSHTAVKKLQS